MTELKEGRFVVHTIVGSNPGAGEVLHCASYIELLSSGALARGARQRSSCDSSRHIHPGRLKQIYPGDFSGSI